MKLKSNVRFGNNYQALCFAVIIIEKIYSEHGYDCVITSVNDSAHSTGSLHYQDSAFDVRTHNITTEVEKKTMLAEIKSSLTEDFDVLIENMGEPNEHLHLEWQPKTIA